MFLRAVLLLGLAGCATPGVVAPSPSPVDEARRAYEANRRLELRLRAGVDAFAARPELARVALQAAYAGAVFCEKARGQQPTYFCTGDNVERFNTVRTASLAAMPSVVAPAEVVAWKIVADASCGDVAHVLASVTPAAPTRTATLELTKCTFEGVTAPWKPSSYYFNGAVCPDGSQPVRVTNCGNGQPCQPAPPRCPCRESSAQVTASIRGAVKFGTRSLPVSFDAAVTNSHTDVESPDPAVAPSARAFFSLQLDGTMSALSRAVEALSLAEADVSSEAAAVACAEVRADPFRVSMKATEACEHAWEREGHEPVVKTTKPRLPEVRVRGGQRQLTLLSEDERVASRLEIERASPGWKVKVSALGFITSATRVTSNEDAEKTLAAVRDFTARNQVALGFVERPAVERNGESFGGPQWKIGSLLAKSGTGDVTIEGHAWPFRCPAVDGAKALAPWLGKTVRRELPGEPCDPQGGRSCESLAPKSEQVPLTLRDVAVQPDVALELEGNEVRLRCVARLTLRGALVGNTRLPEAIDADTGEAMVGGLLSEAQLP